MSSTATTTTTYTNYQLETGWGNQGHSGTVTIQLPVVTMTVKFDKSSGSGYYNIGTCTAVAQSTDNYSIADYLISSSGVSNGRYTTPYYWGVSETYQPADMLSYQNTVVNVTATPIWCNFTDYYQGTKTPNVCFTNSASTSTYKSYQFDESTTDGAASGYTTDGYADLTQPIFYRTARVTYQLTANTTYGLRQAMYVNIPVTVEIHPRYVTTTIVHERIHTYNCTADHYNSCNTVSVVDNYTIGPLFTMPYTSYNFYITDYRGYITDNYTFSFTGMAHSIVPYTISSASFSFFTGKKLLTSSRYSGYIQSGYSQSTADATSNLLPIYIDYTVPTYYPIPDSVKPILNCTIDDSTGDVAVQASLSDNGLHLADIPDSSYAPYTFGYTIELYYIRNGTTTVVTQTSINAKEFAGWTYQNNLTLGLNQSDDMVTMYLAITFNSSDSDTYSTYSLASKCATTSVELQHSDGLFILQDNVEGIGINTAPQHHSITVGELNIVSIEQDSELTTALAADTTRNAAGATTNKFKAHWQPVCAGYDDTSESFISIWVRPTWNSTLGCYTFKYRQYEFFTTHSADKDTLDSITQIPVITYTNAAGEDVSITGNCTVRQFVTDIIPPTNTTTAIGSTLYGECGWRIYEVTSRISTAQFEGGSDFKWCYTSIHTVLSLNSPQCTLYDGDEDDLTL